MKKNHAGSALTSVIMIFFIVTLIGAPLLGMVVYNYRLREFDSGIKEAEYKNEIVMDRIATIIRNDVISSMSLAKDNTTNEITVLTDKLLNSYNTVYDNAVDSVDSKLLSGEITEGEKQGSIKDTMKESFINSIDGIEGIGKEDLVGILNLDESTDLSSGKIDNQKLQEVSNVIFKNAYKKELVANLFSDIYAESEYDDLASAIVFGNRDLESNNDILKDETTKKTKIDSLRVMAKYGYKGKPNDFQVTYNLDAGVPDVIDTFDADGELKIGIEVRNKISATLPVTTLSATYIINTPEFDTVSSIEQQTIALSNPIIDYSLIVGETLTLDGETIVDGNVLARADGIIKTENNGVTTIYDKGIVIRPGASLKSGKDVLGEVQKGDGRIATPGDIIMDSKSGATTALHTGTNPIYYRNLYLGDPSNQKAVGTIDVRFNGDVLAKDDLEINLNSPGTVKVNQESGNYFGYNDKNDDGPDSSSALVINSDTVDKIDISLDNLYLAGRAFIDGVESTTRRNANNTGNMIYKTGESISVKGNYIAYQSPFVGSGDYNGDSIKGDYDVDKIKFSPYFMIGRKNGIDGDTHLTINLADNYIIPISYETFDTENKWSYFLEYASKNLSKIKKPIINISEVMHIQGAGINASGSVSVNGTTVNGLIGRKIAVDDSFKVSKENKFEEFTRFFGYYPSDETKRKEKISDWISFKNTEIKAQDGQLFTYVSKANAGNLELAWGKGSSSGEDIYIKLPNDASNVNGIIMHDGDLTITSNCATDIPFNGMIVVTGNLVIEGDVNITTDKDLVAEIIIQNYLGNSGYVYTGGGNSLDVGDLLGSFVYDDSGSTYVAIDVTDRSNIIDINELVGVTDWKKTNYGRL